MRDLRAMALAGAALGLGIDLGSPPSSYVHREINHLPMQPAPLTKRQRRRLRGKAKGAK